MTTGTLKVDSSQLTTPASYGVALLTFLGSFTLSDWGILTSILLGILTFIVNLYFKIAERRDRLTHLHRQKPD